MSKLDFTKCFAFKDFTLSQNPYEYEYSSIDATNIHQSKVPMNTDYFSLFTFSAKFDPVPAMLTQNHTTTIKGFMGQTTAYRKEYLKSSVLVMGDFKPTNEARYIHGEFGKGTWTFYGGHDPEDYQHSVGDPPTSLAFHSSSPGYRLILNNVLFPAAKKKDVPTVNCCDTPEGNNGAPATTGGSIQIHADPATNEIIVVVPGKGNAKVKVLVTNTYGNEVVNKEMPANNIRISLDVQPAGIYLVQVDGVYAGKVKKD
ncbi:MAG: T9SS C-terminal target domain-containing protein [Chitinophagia bacterium]|nr:T9SS C-terminal target domain-containing protein [Chitinophagia bacterium]